MLGLRLASTWSSPAERKRGRNDDVAVVRTTSQRGHCPLRHYLSVTLRFDEPPTLQEQHCADCGTHYVLVKAFVARDEVALAVTFTALHVHDGIHEAWIDAILGTFGEDRTDDHVTFGCRIGPVQGQVDPAATLVDAAQPYSERPIWGRKLSREEALKHPRLAEYWEVVDYVLVSDPTVEHHVYAHGASHP